MNELAILHFVLLVKVSVFSPCVSIIFHKNPSFNVSLSQQQLFWEIFN